MYDERQSNIERETNAICPLCDTPAYKNIDPRNDTALVVCTVCGKFRFSSEAERYLDSPAKDKRRYRISYSMRSISERAAGKRDNSFFPVYMQSDWEKMLDRPDASVQEKLHSLLRYLGSLSEYPGHAADFDFKHDYSVLGAKNPEEACFYVRALQEQSLLSYQNYSINDEVLQFTLSTNGWVELDRIAQSGVESSNAFIAMWFDPSRSAFYKGIEQAVTNAGYAPVRIDQVEHLNRIDDEIIARIRQSKFLIADFSGQRNGVYFEAGFMLGLGRPVIWLCEKEDHKNVHFDTRQYNTIDYLNVDDLQTRLTTRIVANLGQGPHVTS